jgi:diguanylate cyclase (GGDEF)-like protein/PAS domain S-box-containing protein
MARGERHSDRHLRVLAGLIDELADPAANAHAPRGAALAGMLDGIDVVVFAMSGDAGLLYVNSAWERLSGYAAADTRGTALMDYVHPRDQSAVLRYLEDSERDAEGLVARWVTRDGRCLRLEMRVRALHGGADRHGYVGTLTDVTRRAQAEDVRLASHRTLETLINNLPGMVYRCRNNPDWTMEFVSRGAGDLTGYRPEELINNRRVPYADLIVESDRQRVWDSVQTCLRENRPFELTYRIRTAQGAEKWVLERGLGNFSTNGELLGLEGFITDVTEEKRAELRLQRESLYEAAGDLPTPPLLTDRLERALLRARQGTGNEFALLLVYLDRFAKVRAAYGADFGDRVALAIGRRFQGVLTPLDSLSRWHEDEFAVLLERSDEALAIAQRLLAILRTPILDGETETYLTASIGIALGRNGYQHAEDMLQDAAAAMARAKELGGARIETAVRRGAVVAAAPASIEEELRGAVDNGQFVLGCTPVHSASTHDLAAIDVQLLWEHPRRGRLRAQEFFGIAEHLPMVKALKGWYINTLLAQSAAGRERLTGTRGVRVHVEIAGRCMLEPGFLGRMVTQLRSTAGPQVSFALEISEEMLRDCAAALRESAAVLRAQDVGLIVDVQREGALALDVLQELPLYALRLDEQLLRRGCERCSLATALVGLARELGVHAIGRGISSDEELAAARQFGCDLYQGPLLGAPVDFPTALARSDPHGAECAAVAGVASLH